MYTSGTTGDPKGVMLTHANIIATIAGAISSGLDVRPTDVHLSYLPLAHIFERVVMTAMYAFGACAGFFQGVRPRRGEGEGEGAGW
jgi:long-chain acyl-CoA synthetase